MADFEDWGRASASDSAVAGSPLCGDYPHADNVDVNARDMPEDKCGHRSYETCGKEPVGRPTAPQHGG